MPHATISERAAQKKIIRFRTVTQQADNRLSAMPALKDREFVEKRETGVGDSVSASELA
jgi:hypothetical protein